jgi:transcription initiation factor TFIIB
MNEPIEKYACASCGSNHLIRDIATGEEICSNCGLVLSDDVLDTRPEWRAFTESERRSRSRASVTSAKMVFVNGLSTSFSGSRDCRGNHLDLEVIGKMNRLRRYDNRSKLDDTHARNLSIAMSELERMIAIVHLPDTVKENAALLYRRALKQDLIRGRSIDAFVAACIYAECRRRQIPRSLKEISNASTRKLSEISRTYRLLVKELNLKMPIDDPMKFVSGMASRLKVNRKTEQHAVEILKRAKELQGLAGKEPRGIAAAALYISCIEMKEKRIQKDIATAAGTTEVTLRNRLRGLETVLNGAND